MEQIITIKNDLKPFEGNVSAFPWAQNKLDLNDDNYFDDINYINHSLLTQAWKNPEHYQMIMAGWRDPSKDTAAIEFGKASHRGLLQPDKYMQKYLIFDDADKCVEISGKDWQKNNKKPRGTNEYRAWYADVVARASNNGQKLMPIEDHTTIQNMVDRALSVPQIREYLDYTLKEQIVQYQYQGLRMKGMADVTDGYSFILDYKTLWHGVALQQESLMKVIIEHNYHSQQFSYGQGMNIKDKLILFQQKVYPYTPVIVKLSDAMIKEGQRHFDEMVANLKVHVDSKTGTMKRKPFFMSFQI